MTKRYYVVATMWDSFEEKQVEKIVGEFERFIHASMFQKVYNEHYSADAKVVEVIVD